MWLVYLLFKVLILLMEGLKYGASLCFVLPSSNPMAVLCLTEAVIF
jgi:hypothetical protein